jgi:hypothetical protein
VTCWPTADIARTDTLHWPSLTIEWFPVRDAPPHGLSTDAFAGSTDMPSAPTCPPLTLSLAPQEKELTDDGFFKQRLLYGTYAGEGHTNKLIVDEVELPEDIEPTSQWRSTRSRHALQDKAKPSKTSLQQIVHDGEVHRARCNPHSTGVVATRSVHNDVFVFNIFAHPAKPVDDAAFAPDLRLEGHKLEGWGMAWNVFHPGLLLSGGMDGTMCLWDVEGPAAAGEVSGGGSGRHRARCCSEMLCVCGVEGAIQRDRGAHWVRQIVSGGQAG